MRPALSLRVAARRSSVKLISIMHLAFVVVDLHHMVGPSSTSAFQHQRLPDLMAELNV